MLKKTSVIVFFLLLAAGLYFVYQYYKVPEGVTPMSDSAEKIATISLLTSLVSLLASLVGFVTKLLEMNKKNKDD